MELQSKSIIRFIVILLSSSLTVVLGAGLYNSGKFAGAADSIASPHQVVTPKQTSSPSLNSAFVATAAPVPSTVSGGSSGYLQSETDPSRRIVYQQPQQPKDSSRQDKLSVYRSLQETCQRWTQWYKRDGSANSAVQMNVACREAAEYGRTQLNLNTKAKQVNLKSLKEKPASSGGAVFIGNSSNSNESPRCQDLRRQLERIQSRLRAGYKVQEGERLKKRRREIRDEIQQRC